MDGDLCSFGALVCDLVPGKGQAPNNHLLKEFGGRASRQQQADFPHGAVSGKENPLFLERASSQMRVHDSKRKNGPGFEGS